MNWGESVSLPKPLLRGHRGTQGQMFASSPSDPKSLHKRYIPEGNRHSTVPVTLFGMNALVSALGGRDTYGTDERNQDDRR